MNKIAKRVATNANSLLYCLIKAYLFHLRYFDRVSEQMLCNRCAAGIYDNIPFLDQSPVFQEANLISNDFVDTLFYLIIKGLNTPTQTQLIHQTLGFGKYKQRRTWSVAGQHKSCITRLRHAD